MRSFFARIFRALNARLVATDQVVVEKFLKIFMALSVFMYRRLEGMKFSEPVMVIDNYDGDIKMKVDRSRSMGLAIFWTGFHEFRELQFLHRFLKSDMVFIDVGANQGEYALFAAKRLTSGKVIAFEPLPSIRKVLMRNIEMNGFRNIKVFDVGLSDREQTLVIHEVEDKHEGLATIHLGDRISRAAFPIQLKPLDDVYPDAEIGRVDIIKIDIEGSELMCLKGSRKLIEKYRPVVMIETNEKTYEAAGYHTIDIKNFFDALGYQAFEIKKKGSLAPCQTLPMFANIIFKPV